jgi:hypothetical protein
MVIGIMGTSGSRKLLSDWRKLPEMAVPNRMESWFKL